MAMFVICYICNKQTVDCCQNFVENTSQYTQTPIAVFIRQFLGDFESTRNIDDELNCICVECLQQIDDYDWMRQQASERETKLRELLLATEKDLNIQREPVEIKTEQIGESHNGGQIQQQQSIPVLLMSATQSQQASISLTTPTIQANHAHTFATIINPNDAATQNILGSTAHHGPTVLDYSKPVFPYPCLMVLALKNSLGGSLVTSEIYSFICEHFPYFKTAKEDWKCGIRSMLSHNGSFEKTGVQINKNHLWRLNPSKLAKWDEEIQKWLRSHKTNIENAMAKPENLPALIRGEIKYGGLHNIESSEENVYAKHNEDGYLDDEPVICADTPRLLSMPTSSRQNNPSSQFIRPAYQSNYQSSTMATAENIPQNILGLTVTTNVNAITAEPPSSNNSTVSEYPKPVFSYPCLIALALKNSPGGTLLVTEIYSFFCEHFPYFRTASEDWKRKIRDVLTKSYCFEKTEVQIGNTHLWRLHPSNLAKRDEEIQKWLRSDTTNIRNSMAVPENLPALIRGDMKHGGSHNIKCSEENVCVKHNDDGDYDDDNYFVDESIICDDLPTSSTLNNTSLQMIESAAGNMSNNTTTMIPTIQSNHEQFVTITSPNDAVPQNILSSTAVTNVNAITAEPSSSSSPLLAQHDTIANSFTVSEYPKPAFPYSWLTALALKNSPGGSLVTSEIYSFLCEHFPYFQTASEDWKCAIRNVLSSNACFEKTEIQMSNNNQTGTRTSYLWKIVPSKLVKLDDEIQKWLRTDSMAIQNAIAVPENSSALIRGELKNDGLRNLESSEENVCAKHNDDEDDDDDDNCFADETIICDDLPTSSTLSNTSSHMIESSDQSNHQSSSVTISKPLAENISKPNYSYPCLIAMALLNSPTGFLTTADIYSFISENFPYFKMATDKWKNTVRMNLSSGIWFKKTPVKKGSKAQLWAIKQSKIKEMKSKIQAFSLKNSDNTNNATEEEKETPSFEHVDVEHSSLNGCYIELDDTDDSDDENDPDVSITNNEEIVDAECHEDESIMIEEINVDELKPPQFDVITVIDDDEIVQPMEKRARIDID